MADTINMDDPLSSDTPPNRAGTPPPDTGRERAPAKPKGTSKANAQAKAEAKEIEQKLSALIIRPAIPMHAIGDEWPAQHLEATGPAFAKALARKAEENANLRAQLLRLLRVGDDAGLVISGLLCAVPILAYYEVLPVPPLVRSQLGVPRRAEARGTSVMDVMRDERAEAERLAAMQEAAVGFEHGNAPPSVDPEPPPENTVAAQAPPIPAPRP